jgi:excinuclease ABC subunit A
MTDGIRIRGAREHNLKNISLDLPRNKMIVVTGLSGSGKSSLAFNTIYAEGQRRYVESLSAYARQFLELMEKPDVDLIEGLSPAIAIEQRTPSHNPRSTVGTVTEIYDHLRLLYARVGTPHCPTCRREIHPQSASQIIAEISKTRTREKTSRFWRPWCADARAPTKLCFEKLKKSGLVRVRVNGTVHDLDKKIKLDRYKKHTIEAVIDRLAVSSAGRERLADSVETALREARGVLIIAPADIGARFGSEGESLFSEHHACAHCGTSLPEIEPRLFSFNSPYGACANCDGLGVKLEIAEDLVIPNPDLSINGGALSAWSDPVTTRTNRWKKSWSGYYMEILTEVCRRNNIPMNRPWKSLSREQRRQSPARRVSITSPPGAKS